MSFQFFKLRIVPFTSPASRFTFKYFTYWNYQKKYSKLATHVKWNAGRSAEGKIIFRSKASKSLKKRTININYIYRWRKIAVLSTFQFLPLRNKLLSLILFANGMATYVVTSEFQRLFMYIFWNSKKKLKKFGIRLLCLPIGRFKRLSYISLLEVKPGRGAQYTRSAGTRSRLIKYDYDLKTALLILPSKVKKIISYYCIAFLGRVAVRAHNYCTSNKAGHWRNFGFKPIVRGVAMNPVDHPHGGRTKSVKYPMTPWGKTTKFK